MLNSPDYGAYVQVILDEKIPVVETAGRKPGEWVKKFKQAGTIVIHKCTSIRHAISAQNLGVDMVWQIYEKLQDQNFCFKRSNRAKNSLQQRFFTFFHQIVAEN